MKLHRYYSPKFQISQVKFSSFSSRNWARTCGPVCNMTSVSSPLWLNSLCCSTTSPSFLLAPQAIRLGSLWNQSVTFVGIKKVPRTTVQGTMAPPVGLEPTTGQKQKSCELRSACRTPCFFRIRLPFIVHRTRSGSFQLTPLRGC